MTRHRFGHNPEFELLVRERLLLKDGEAVALGSRSLDVLIALVERAGQVVSRRHLMELVWPETPVEDNNLNVQVCALRKVLGGRLIATIPGRGYSFTPLLNSGGQPRTADAFTRLRTHLPATLAPMFGRQADLAELDALLSTHRLVTLLGPGGIGKTLLAQHLLRRHEARFRHGGCLVELSGLQDPSAIPAAIASAMQIQLNGGTALNGLASAMEPLDIMVVLDNAEHLVDAVAQVAHALHNASPALRLVVTSQAPLQLAAERIHRIGPLSVPEAPTTAADALQHGAIALLVDRAQAVDSRFALTDDAVQPAIDLCRNLDGLPLAIELAAWRAPTLGVRRLVESLHEPLKVLTGSGRGKPHRLQTLRNALDWSHGLLDSHAQAVFRRLSVLVGSGDLQLVQDVACDRDDDGPIDEWVVLDALTTLVGRSLVAVVPAPDGLPRYRLLEMPRAYAREKLAIAGEVEAVERRHASAVSRRFAEAYAERFGAHINVGDWVERLYPEVDNGQAALAWARRNDEPDFGVALLPGLIRATPREERTKAAETVTLCSNFAARAAPGPHALWTLLEAASLATIVDLKQSCALADAAIALGTQCAEQLPDERWHHRALCQRALAHLIGGETQRGLADLDAARRLEKPSWPAPFYLLRSLAEIWLADRNGDGEASYRAALQRAQLSREAGTPEWTNTQSLVSCALSAGRPEDAVRHGLDGLRQLEGTRHIGDLCDIRIQLVGALIQCRRLDEAREHSRAVWPFAVRISRQDALADYLSLLAALEGRPVDAARLLGYANKLCRDQQAPRAGNEQAAVRQTLDILTIALGKDELEASMKAGESMSASELTSVAFRDAPDVPALRSPSD